MRITIIPADTWVSINNEGYNKVDVSSLSSNIHAIQWFDDHGWIEIKNSDGLVVQNEEITSIDWLQPVIDSWKAIDYAHKNPTPVDPVPPTAEENKYKAEGLLISTDWTQLPDVNLQNKEEFATYRTLLRNIVLNPVDGFIDWPVKPEEVWLAV